MVAFVTPCEAYVGIEPHFNLLNYFFHARLQQGSSVEVAILVSVDIFVRSWHGVDPYSPPPCRDLQMGGGKYGSFYGMTLTRRSSCSQVAAPSSNRIGGTMWSRRTSVRYNPCVKSFNNYVVADALSRKAHYNYLLVVCLTGEESSTRVLDLSLFNSTLTPTLR
jgi:hypothetical protein